MLKNSGKGHSPREQSSLKVERVASLTGVLSTTF